MAEEAEQQPEQEEADGSHLLSNHCAALRRALQHCLDKSREIATASPASLKADPAADDESVGQEERAVCLEEARAAARSLPQYRNDNLESFHKSLQSSCERPAIATVENLREAEVSPLAFRRAFEHANLPCKVAGLPRSCFEDVHRRFAATKDCRARSDLVDADGRDQYNTEDAVGLSTGREVVVNRTWFLEALGPQTIVPVRLDPSAPHEAAATPPDACPGSETCAPAASHAGLDADGRATECETRRMALRQWIDVLDSAEASNADPGRKRATGAAAAESSVSSFYLKDWHLQSLLNRQCRSTAPSTENVEENESGRVAGLYRVPAHFGHDLLNHFLTTFFVDEDGNYVSDYFFCYWGPAGSQTGRHSDVLNSFSWSYNVCGRKKWTFYPPPPCPPSKSGTADPNSGQCHRCADTPIVLHQRAGECVFVPSGWQHSVVNCQETLSLNHNCVTTANVDLVWACLCQEMCVIERELAAWDAPVVPFSSGRRREERTDAVGPEADDGRWDARESMLRGCVGLDVTAFYLMVTFGIIDRCSRFVAAPVDLDDVWEYVFDLTRLHDTLLLMIQSESLHLLQRLQASLGDQTLARKAHELGEAALELVDERIQAVVHRVYC